MVAADFRALVRELCESHGLADWQAVADNRHLIVDDTLVGLLHDERHAPDHLCLYLSLGEYPMSAEFMTQLLSHNVLASPEDGCLGVLPSSGTIAYRVNIPWDESLRGDSLGGIITRHVQRARRAIRHCSRSVAAREACA